MIRRFFNEFDMFYAEATLRAKEKPETSSTFAGVMSFLLVLLFTYVFIVKSVQIFTYQNIEGQQSRIRIHNDQPKADQILFAISIDLKSLETFEGILQLEALAYDYETNLSSTIQMEQCKLEHWANLSTYAKQHYNEHPMQKFLCPKSGQNLKLKHSFTAELYSYVEVQINICSNSTSSVTCKSQAYIQQFMLNQILENRYLSTWIYLFDNAVNMNEKNAVESFINARNKLSFTIKRGMQAEVQFGTYKVFSDQSLLPWQQLDELEGNYFDDIHESTFQRINSTFPFVIVKFVMNNKEILVRRQFGKIDDTLAYAGGLFTLIIAFLSFFLNSYNEYRYQLMVAEGAFNYNDDGKKIKQKDFKFHTYIKYSFFDWVNALCCCKLHWDDCRQIDQTRNEALCQMDVSRLFKKIQNMETALKYMMNEDEKICLTLIEPPTMKVVRHHRLIYEYYHAVIKGEPAMTIEDVIINNEILKIGVELAKKERGEHLKVDDIIQNRSNILEIALTAFPNIVKEADELNLSQQLLNVEKEIANSFFKLSPQSRAFIQQKIPIKIIHRLRMRQDYVNSVSSFQIIL